MAIYGERGPKTTKGTMNKMLTGDGRKDLNKQISNNISDMSGGIFGKKRRK